MAAFNLTAQLQLQAPNNIPQVVSAIRKQLAPIGIKVNVTGDPRSLAQINQQLQSTQKYAKNSARSIGELNRTLQESARRFSVITLATGTLLSLAAAFKNSVRSAIDFEKSMVNLSQVTGKTTDQLKPLADEVTKLATTLGTSSKDLIDAAQTLAQAGFSAEKTKKALDILAQTTLASSFGSITETTEGAIAALSQFTSEATSTGAQIQFLENTLNSINAVSKAFAVESSDLVTVIRRTGGVFAAAGGSVEELIALFTSVRATTRESAETIATGLRTIFTRIQRPETIDQLKQLGIELQDSEGKFVGAYEAVKRLSAGLSALDPKDIRFSGIVEELGGFRQVGKVIPLIKQFAVAQDALNVAQSASGSIAEDARIAQQSLANQIVKLREEFDALIRKFAASETFRSLAGGALELARAFIKVADSLEPLLPLITSLFALKLGSGLAPAIASFAGIGSAARSGGLGRVSKFARGGMVPGSGSGDTVPAMLTPGEFVIRKSSVKKLGASTLHAMNQNRFEKGKKINFSDVRQDLEKRRQTKIAKEGETYKSKKLEGSSVTVLDSVGRLSDEVQSQLSSGKNLYGAAFLRPEAQGQIIKGSLPPDSIANAIRGNKRINTILSLSKRANDNSIIAKLNKEIPEIINAANSNKFLIKAGSLTATESSKLEETLLKGITNTVKSGASQISNQLKFPSRSDDVGKLLKTINVDNIVGNLFEGVLSSAGGFWRKRVSNASFDFPNGLKDLSSKFGLSDISEKPSDAKSTFTADNISSFTNKVKNFESQSAIDKIDKVIKNSGLIEKIQQIKGTELKPNITRTSQELGLNITPRMGKRGEDPFDPVRNLVESTKPTRRRASGGGISGSDTVPALLTPGEFVVNKKSASRIGYGNLARMNKTGVAHFARGGFVGVQRFAGGGTPLPSHLDPDRIMNKYGSFFNSAPLPGGVKIPGGGITPEAKSALNDANTVFKDLGLSAKMSAKALKVMYEEMKKGEDVSKSFEKAVHAINEELKNKPKAQPQITAGMALSQGLDKIQNVASAAQNFVFLGASIAAVTSQMSSLDDATKKAINQTAGFAAAAVGIGSTLVNTISSLIQTATSSKILSAACLDTAKSVATLGASTKGAIGLQQMTKGAALVNQAFLGLTAVIAAVSIVFTFFEFQQNLAAAKAEELGKSFDEAIEKLRTSGGINKESVVQAKIDQVITEQQAAAFSVAKSSGSMAAALSSAAVTAGAFAITAAGIASPSGPFAIAAAAIALVVGAVVGLSKGLSDYNSEINKSKESLDQFRKSIQSSIDVLINLVEAGRLFDENIKEIDLNKFLSPEEKTRKKIIEQERLSDILKGVTATGEKSTDFAGKKEVRGKTILEKSLSELSDLALSYGVGINEVQNKENRKALGVNPQDNAKIELAIERIKEYSLQMSKSLQQARDNFFEIAQSNLGVDPNQLDKIKNDTNTALGRAYVDYRQAIELDTRQRIDTLARERENAKTLSEFYGKQAIEATRLEPSVAKEEFEKNSALQKKYAKEFTDAESRRIKEQERANKRLKELDKSIEEQNNRIIENNKARIDEFNAMQKLRGEIEESQRIGAVLKRFIDALDKNTTYLENQQTTISNIAGSSGQRLKISAPKIQEIGNVTDVRNRDVFNREINLVASRFGKAGEEYANRVKKNSELFDKASKELITAPRFGATDKDTKKQAEDILAKAGIDESIGKDLYKTLLKNIIDKLSKGGEIKAEDAAQLLDPLKKVLEEDAKRLQEFQDLYQKEIDNYSKYIDAVDEYRKRELEGLANVASTIIRAIDIRARATGREEEAGFAKELIRTLAAQQQLNVAGAGRGGAGAVAGNLGSLATARRSAMGMLTGITDEINRLENGGGPEGEARKTRLQELMAAESKQRSIIEATNKELERLADQSEKVADIQSRIEKEQRKRGQIKDFVKDFVTSGQEQRMSTMNAIQGLNVAYSQGTLQVLDEETRKAVAGLLESLSEVQLPGGGGATGKQILDEFILRDAFAAGFPPEWIQALRGATTQEQRLINALGALTDQMVMASRIRAEMPKAPIPVNVVNLDELKKRQQVIKPTESPPSPYSTPKPFDDGATTPSSEAKTREQLIDEELRAWSAGVDIMVDKFASSIEEFIYTLIMNETTARAGDGLGVGDFLPYPDLPTTPPRLRRPKEKSKGGLIEYYSDGGGLSTFQSKGTDTVPAMLTPGEYVVRKSAVDKVGVGTLDAINNGTLYASKGDIVPGARYYGDGGFVLPFPETGLDTKEAEENRKAVLKHIEQQKDKVSTQAQNAYNQWIDKALQKRLKQIDPLAEWRDEMLNNETLKRQREELILPTDDQAYQVWKKTNKLGQGFMPKITMSSPPSIGGRRMYPKVKDETQNKQDEVIQVTDPYKPRIDPKTGETIEHPDVKKAQERAKAIIEARKKVMAGNTDPDVRKLAEQQMGGRKWDPDSWKHLANTMGIPTTDKNGNPLSDKDRRAMLRSKAAEENKAKRDEFYAAWDRIRANRGIGPYGGGGLGGGAGGAGLIPGAAAGAFDKDTGIQPVLPGGQIPGGPTIPNANDISIISGTDYYNIITAAMRKLSPESLMDILDEYGTVDKPVAQDFIKRVRNPEKGKTSAEVYDNLLKNLFVALAASGWFQPIRGVLDKFIENKDMFLSAGAAGLKFKAPEINLEEPDQNKLYSQLDGSYKHISTKIGDILSAANSVEDINNEDHNKIFNKTGVQPIVKQTQNAFRNLLGTKDFIDKKLIFAENTGKDKENKSAAAEKLKELHSGFIGERSNISTELDPEELTQATEFNDIQSILDNLTAFNFAKGGKVGYFSGGGSLFKPKGTDTVPAMLTPGEFVISKPAVDKIGVGTLNAINDGTMYASKGGPVYFKSGGKVSEVINTQLENLVKILKKINDGLDKFEKSVSRGTMANIDRTIEGMRRDTMNAIQENFKVGGPNSIQFGGRPPLGPGGKKPTAEELGYESARDRKAREIREANAKRLAESRAPRVNTKTGETIEHPDVKKAQEAAMAGIRAGTGVPGARNRQTWENLANTMGIPKTDKDGKPLSPEARRAMLRNKAKEENKAKRDEFYSGWERIRSYRERKPYTNMGMGVRGGGGSLIPASAAGAFNQQRGIQPTLPSSNALFNVQNEPVTRIKTKPIESTKQQQEQRKLQDDLTVIQAEALQNIRRRQYEREDKAKQQRDSNPAMRALREDGVLPTNYEMGSLIADQQAVRKSVGLNPYDADWRITRGGKYPLGPGGKKPTAEELGYESERDRKAREIREANIRRRAEDRSASYVDPTTLETKYYNPETQAKIDELKKVNDARNRMRIAQREGKPVDEETRKLATESPIGRRLEENAKKAKRDEESWTRTQAERRGIPEGPDQKAELRRQLAAENKAKRDEFYAGWDRIRAYRGIFPKNQMYGPPTAPGTLPQTQTGAGMGGPGAPIGGLGGGFGGPMGMPDLKSLGEIIGKTICECVCNCLKQLIGSIQQQGTSSSDFIQKIIGIFKGIDIGAIFAKGKEIFNNVIDNIKSFGSKLIQIPIVQKAKDFISGMYEAYQTWNKIKEGAAKVKEKAQPITDLGKSIWDQWKKKQQEKEDNTPSPSDKPMEDLPKPRPKLPSTTLPNLGIGPIPIPDQQPESKPEIEASPVDINRTPQGIETGVIPNIQDIISNNIAAGMQRADSSAQPKLENNVEIPRLSSNKSPVIPNKLWESVSEAVRKSTDVMMNNLPDTNLSGENIVDTIIKRYKNQKTQTPKTQAQRKNVPLQDEDGPSPSDNLRPGGIFNVPDTRVERIKPKSSIIPTTPAGRINAVGEVTMQSIGSTVNGMSEDNSKREQALQEFRNNPAIQRRMQGEYNTNEQAYGPGGEYEATQKLDTAFGRNKYDSQTPRVTVGGKPFPKAGGIKYTAEELGYEPERDRKAREIREANIRRRAEDRSASYVDPSTLETRYYNPETQAKIDELKSVNDARNRMRIAQKEGKPVDEETRKLATESPIGRRLEENAKKAKRDEESWTRTQAERRGIPEGPDQKAELRRQLGAENKAKRDEFYAGWERIRAYRGIFPKNQMYGPPTAPGTLPQAETGAGMGGPGAPIGGLGGGFGGPMGMPDPRSLGDIIGRTICECLCKCIKEAIMSITSMGGGIGGGGMGGLGGAMGGSGGPFGFINSIIDIGKSLYEKFKQTKIFESISSLFGGGEKTSAEPTPTSMPVPIDGLMPITPENFGDLSSLFPPTSMPAPIGDVMPLESITPENFGDLSSLFPPSMPAPIGGMMPLESITPENFGDLSSLFPVLETPQEKPTFGSMLGKGVGDFLSSGINKVGEIFTGIKDTFQTIVTPTTTPTASMAPSTSGGWMFGGGAGMNMIPPDLFSRMMPQQPQNIDLCRCVSESIRNAESNYKMAEGGAGRGRERFMGGPEQPKVVEINNTGGYMAMATPKEEGKGSIAGDLDAFASNISNVFSGITSTFTGFMNSLDSFVERFTGFKFEHNVTVEGLISIGGLNIESISSEITESISDLVTQEVKRQLNDKPFEAGG